MKGIVPISDSPIKLKSTFLQYAELPSPAKRYRASLQSEFEKAEKVTNRVRAVQRLA